MKKLKLMFALAALAIMPKILQAADASYFSKFVAPGQNLFWNQGSEVGVGTTTLLGNPSLAFSAGFSTDPLKGPVLIMSSNTQRIGWSITNISTRIANNPLGDIRIYIGTSPVTVGWSTSTLNQETASLQFSSNAFPAPLPTTWVLDVYSTTPYIDANIRNMSALGISNDILSFSSNTLVNVRFTGPDTLGGPRITKNYAYQLPGDLNTYVGDIYAIAVGTGGANIANGAVGRVRVTQTIP